MKAHPPHPQDSQGLSQALLALARQRHIQPDLITQLQRESEPFREICADYEECCSKLISLEQAGEAAREKVEDFEEMRDLLERDVVRWLQGTFRIGP